MILLLVLGVIAYFVYTKVYKPLYFWEGKGVPYMDPWDQIKSMLATIFRRKHIFELTKEQYNMFPDKRYFGMFALTKQALAVRDIDLVKQITVKDFDHFTDHVQVIPPEVEPLLSKHLLSMKGQAWRDMRSTLSPAFTSSKMKSMFTLMYDCAKDMNEYLLEKYRDKEEEVEMKDLFTRYTNDVIATTAFGIKCDSFREPENSFYIMGKEILNFSGFAVLKVILYAWFPKLMKFLRVRILAKSVSGFFSGIIMQTVEKREKEHIIRPDMIHLLMEARKGNLKHENASDANAGFATVEESEVGKAQTQKHQRKDISDEDLTAQALIFFLAGFDTASTVMSFTALELAINVDVQRRLLDEIDEVLEKYGEKITYDAILQMKYLDQVLSEALRKWAPAVQTDRVCIKDYTIDPVKPTEKTVHIEKGTLISILIAGIHYDAKYFPNPEKFDPERFNDENKGSIVPGSYLPFGIGPRNCIGSRFALLEIKILFFHLLSKFELVVGKKTAVPIKISRINLDLRPENGFWVELKARKVTSL